jgi:hypothetical protein
VHAELLESRYERPPDERARFDMAGRLAQPIGGMPEIPSERADVAARQVGEQTRSDGVQTDHVERERGIGVQPRIQSSVQVA